MVNDGRTPSPSPRCSSTTPTGSTRSIPVRTLERRDAATISILYPWVQDEAHAIALVSETGVLFEAEIPVAMESPRADQESVARFALVGLYVGVVPVALGLLWYPSMRRLGRRGMNFVSR